MNTVSTKKITLHISCLKGAQSNFSILNFLHIKKKTSFSLHIKHMMPIVLKFVQISKVPKALKLLLLNKHDLLVQDDCHIGQWNNYWVHHKWIAFLHYVLNCPLFCFLPSELKLSQNLSVTEQRSFQLDYLLNDTTFPGPEGTVLLHFNVTILPVSIRFSNVTYFTVSLKATTYSQVH